MQTTSDALATGRETPKKEAMTIVRWDPFRELSAMQNRVNRVFGANRGFDDDVMRRGLVGAAGGHLRQRQP